MTYIHHYESPLGKMTMASDGRALTGLWFDGQKHFGSTLGPEPVEARLEVFDDTARWLDVYFSGREPDFTPPLSLEGTAFRMSVWARLREIPYGRTTTYVWIAGSPASARAVGGAVARNPISIIVPCHRVMGADGSLIGYAGGVARKIKLLELEKADVRGLMV